MNNLFSPYSMCTSQAGARCVFIILCLQYFAQRLARGILNKLWLNKLVNEYMKE